MVVWGEACWVSVLENIESMVAVVELVEPPPVNLLAVRDTAVSPPVLHESRSQHTHKYSLKHTISLHNKTYSAFSLRD